MRVRHNIAVVDRPADRRALRIVSAAQRLERVRCMRTGGRHEDQRAAADRSACRDRARVRMTRSEPEDE